MVTKDFCPPLPQVVRNRASSHDQVLQFHPFGDVFVPFLSYRLHDGLADTAGFWSLFLSKEDIAEAWLPLALRPRIHAVAKRAATATFGRDRPHLVLGVLQHACEHLETGAAEVFGNVLHLDRIAQVRLVRAVLAQRLAE